MCNVINFPAKRVRYSDISPEAVIKRFIAERDERIDRHETVIPIGGGENITITTNMNSICITGTKENLINLRFATPNQFPTGSQKRLAKYVGYDVGKAKNTGGGLEWAVILEKGGVYTITKTRVNHQ